MADTSEIPKLSVKSLKGKYESLLESLNNSKQVELGPKFYPKARKMTLAMSKGNLSVLKQMLKEDLDEFDRQEKEKAQKEHEHDHEHEHHHHDDEDDSSEPRADLIENQEAHDVEIGEDGFVRIHTMEDLTSVIMSVVHEIFYNPSTGFWPKYDKQFDKEEYTKLGKPGWDDKTDSPKRLQAREEINRKKKKEFLYLMKEPFVIEAVDKVNNLIQQQVEGVKRKEVRHAIRNHVRFHLYHLVYMN